MRISFHMSNHMLVYTFSVCCHMCISSTRGYAFVCFTVQYLYFKHRMSRSKHKSNGDIAGTSKKLQVKMMKTKVKIIDSGVR